MNDTTLRELNAHAERVAALFGATAAVTLIQRQASQVSAGGPAIRLAVVVGDPPSGPGQTSYFYFRPSLPNLEARIDAEIARLVDSATRGAAAS
jgi:hypothetical protein